MTNYILSTRNFRNEFIEKMKITAPDYQFIVANELPDQFDWQRVVITIGWSNDWTPYLLEQPSHLKWVQSISAGVDYLPLASFAKKGILLSNSSGIHAQAITDHLLAIIFMEARGIFQAINQQQQQLWDPQTPNYQYLSDKRVLIVGTGKIGQKLAEALEFFGSSPVGINTSGHPAPHFSQTFALAQLLEQTTLADTIINILPLTDETTHLYDQHFFDAMKKTATFINVGRGASVATEDLTLALQKKKLAFAALDVFEEEPLPADHLLWRLDNCLITPHISGKTPHFQQAFMTIFLANLKKYIKESTLQTNQVNLRKGY